MEKKILDSTQTVSELRLSPFMPIQKISSRSVTYKEFIKNGNKLERSTPFGKIVIRNRLLTQHHSDIFNLIMAIKIDTKLFSTGQMAIYFSLYEIAKKLNITWSGQSAKDLEETIQQIADCRIIRYKNDKPLQSYKLIDDVKFSKNKNMWGIILSKEYVEHFYTDLTIDYKKRISEIVNITGEGSGLIKAIINHFITHKANQDEDKGIVKINRISLMTLLETVNYPTNTKRQITSAKSFIKKFNKVLLKFNIKYDNKSKIFEYGGTKDINFISAIKNGTNQ